MSYPHHETTDGAIEAVGKVLIGGAAVIILMVAALAIWGMWNFGRPSDQVWGTFYGAVTVIE